MYGSGLLRWYMRRMNLSAEYSSMIRLIAGSAFAQGGHHVPVNTSTTVLFADVPVARGSGPFAVVPRSARFPPAMGKAIMIDPTTSNITTIPTETAMPDFWRMVSPPWDTRCYSDFRRRIRQRKANATATATPTPTIASPTISVAEGPCVGTAATVMVRPARLFSSESSETWCPGSMITVTSHVPSAEVHTADTFAHAPTASPETATSWVSPAPVGPVTLIRTAKVPAASVPRVSTDPEIVTV